MCCVGLRSPFFEAYELCSLGTACFCFFMGVFFGLGQGEDIVVVFVLGKLVM